MIIFLYGLDSYRRRQRLKEIIAENKELHQSTIPYYFDLSERNKVSLLRDFVRQKSLLTNFRLGILRGLFDCDEDLEELLAETIESNDLIIIVSEEEKPKKLYKFFLKNPVVYEEFDFLPTKNLNNFILEEAGKRKLNISSQFVNKLMLSYRNDTWAYITELDRLVFSGTENVSRMSGIDGDYFFKLLNGLRGYNLSGRLMALELLLAENEEPAKIFNILAAQKNLKNKFANYDLLVKSGKLEYEEVLLDFVLA